MPIRLDEIQTQIHTGLIRRHYFLPIAKVGDEMPIRLDEIQIQIQIHKYKFTQQNLQIHIGRIRSRRWNACYPSQHSIHFHS